MKKIIFIIISIFIFSSASALEKTKEEKVAKFVLENIQKDYTTCYGFYKIASESFKKANAKKSMFNNEKCFIYNKAYYEEFLFQTNGRNIFDQNCPSQWINKT